MLFIWFVSVRNARSTKSVIKQVTIKMNTYRYRYCSVRYNIVRYDEKTIKINIGTDTYIVKPVSIQFSTIRHNIHFQYNLYRNAEK
ncbi:hypothetical protein HanIR_Chr09g0420221 [Helianthus annuus]|nr:hypothetical protein HanIR_Chr09g0420221 [Helianthus annuus]